MGKPPAKGQWHSLNRICFLLAARRKKPLLRSQKKGGKIATLGSAFVREEWKSADKIWGGAENLSQAGPSQKGMAISENVGLYQSPKLRRKAVFFFLERKSGIFHARCAGHTSKKSEQNRFFRRFPLLEKRKKGEKKNWVSL